jgi:prevent-host-death family protein
MKRLPDLQLLVGQQETITVTDLREGPGDVLLQVQLGKSFRITKNGKVVADLTPPEPTAIELGAAARELSSSY